MDFKDIEEYLKSIVNEEAIDYLSREPYEVYLYLTEDMELDKR